MNNELNEKLARLHWLRHKLRVQEYRRGGHLADVTRGQGRIIAALKLQDGISTRDLAYVLGLHVATLNEMLAKLVKGGYVTREPSEQDKRISLVTLTEKGKNETQPPTTDFSDMFAGFSDEERKALSGYLDRIIAALQSKLGMADEDLEARWEEVRQHRRERKRMKYEREAENDAGFRPRRRGGHGHAHHLHIHGFGFGFGHRHGHGRPAHRCPDKAPDQG
ncbi:MAG: MarR family transcriptional regulator [Coriobacteriales bacterium]|nr:MarR family transcriptional regulator [Coriobacteriales bacterium]